MHTIWVKAPYSGLYMAILNPLTSGDTYASPICYMFAPLLKDKISMFIPELPNYGLSTSTPDADTRTVGNALLEAGKAAFPNRPIILGGHDRGARICHRLAVDHAHLPDAGYELLGLVMLDIVPTLVQWQSFSSPVASTAYFHWPFLASPDSAKIILAYGGDKWTHGQLSRIAGPSPSAVQAAKSDQAWDVYESQFLKPEAVEGSCADYAAAGPGAKAQEEDQAAGKKIEVSTLVMWSLGRLGKMHGDVEKIWKQWIKDGVDLKAVGCGDDVGHYLPEEASDLLARTIADFIAKVAN